MTIIYHSTTTSNAKSIIERGIRVHRDRVLADQCASFYINPRNQLDTGGGALMEFLWNGDEQMVEQLFDPRMMIPDILYNQGQDAKIVPISGPLLIFRGIAIGYPPGNEPQEGRGIGQTLLEDRVLIADANWIADDFKAKGWFSRSNPLQKANEFFVAALGQPLTVDWF